MYGRGLDVVDGQTLQTNWELVVAHRHHVVDVGLDVVHLVQIERLLHVTRVARAHRENGNKLLGRNIHVCSPLRSGEDDLP